MKVRSYLKPREWRFELAHTSIYVDELSTESSYCASGEPQLSNLQSQLIVSLVVTFFTFKAVLYNSAAFYRHP